MKYLVIALLVIITACNQPASDPGIVYDGELYDLDLRSLPKELSDSSDAKLGYAIGISSSIQMGRDSVPMDLRYYIMGLIHGLNQDTSNFWLSSTRI